MELTVKEALKRGISAHKAGDFPEAERLYKTILSVDPQHADANHNLGVLAVGVGKVQESLPLFKAALEANSNQGQYWLSYIDAFIRLGQLDNARSVLEQGRSIGLNGDQVDQLEKQLGEGFNATQLANLNDGINRLATLYENQQYEHCLLLGGKLLGIHPYSASLYNLMGATTRKNGNPEMALPYYKKALILEPSFIEPYINKGLALKTIGDVAHSIKIFGKAIITDPNTTQIYGNLADSFFQIGLLHDAVREFQKTIVLEPSNKRLLNNLGSSYSELGLFESACTFFERSLTLEPNNGLIRFNLGNIYLNKGYLERAEQHFSQTNFGMSRANQLSCLYQLERNDEFFSILEHLGQDSLADPLSASLITHSAIKYGRRADNGFCADPIKELYHKKNVIGSFVDFNLVQSIQQYIDRNQANNRHQELLEGGWQSAGNIFLVEEHFTDVLEKIILNQIDLFKRYHASSDQGFITKWPAKYQLYGWLVSMQKGNTLKSHIHKTSWISGSLYLNVPPKASVNDGNLVVSLHGGGLPTKGRDTDFPQKIINVETGDICIFPSSLFHYTLPFSSDQKRLVCAFDLLPL